MSQQSWDASMSLESARLI